jgi:hypothetical protein
VKWAGENVSYLTKVQLSLPRAGFIRIIGFRLFCQCVVVWRVIFGGSDNRRAFTKCRFYNFREERIQNMVLFNHFVAMPNLAHFKIASVRWHKNLHPFVFKILLEPFIAPARSVSAETI